MVLSEQQIEQINREMQQKIMQINIAEQNERGLWENDHQKAVERGMYWEQKRREIMTEASRKINEIAERQRLINDAQVIGKDQFGRPVTEKMLHP